MCTHAHAHACTRTHARTHTHTHARTHGNGGGGGHGGGSGSGGYGGRGGGSASQIITWHRATISQRGFPHVAQATVSSGRIAYAKTTTTRHTFYCIIIAILVVPCLTKVAYAILKKHALRNQTRHVLVLFKR